MDLGELRNRRALRHLAIERRVLTGLREVDLTARFLELTLPSPIVGIDAQGMLVFETGVCVTLVDDLSMTWADADWLFAQRPRPFGLKGIMSVADALLALEHGVDFIWISNAGFDDGRATIDVLPEIADALARRMPIVIDGGFRSGADAIKALALGATLVAYADADLGTLKDELRTAMQLAGQTVASRIPRSVIRRIDASGFAGAATMRQSTGDPEADLIAQLTPRQREVVREISDDPALSEVDKMWGITEALFGADVQKG